MRRHSFWRTWLLTTQIGVFGLSEQNYGFGKVREPGEGILAIRYVIRYYYYNCTVCVHAVGLLHSVIWVASIIVLPRSIFCYCILYVCTVVFVSVCEIKLLLLTKFHMCCFALSTSSINGAVIHFLWMLLLWLGTEFLRLKTTCVWSCKKQSHYRPWQALRVPGVWGSQILRQLEKEGDKVVSPTHRPPLPQLIFLVLIYVSESQE
jgi:hypothetical protein